jgi:hypothetical protein
MQKNHTTKRINIRFRSAILLSLRFMANFMLAIAGAVAMSMSRTMGVAILIMLVFTALWTVAQILVDTIPPIPTTPRMK